MAKRSQNEIWHGPGGEADSHREFVRGHGCVADNATPRDCGIGWASGIEAHHVRSRGAGGGYEVLVGLCRHHHRRVHELGRDTFAARFEIDLPAEAARLMAAHYPEEDSDE